MRITIFLIAAISFLLSCNNKKEKPAAETKPVTTESSQADDSTAIRKVITDFYTWYVKSDSKLMAFNLYDGIKKKDSPPYKINWDVVEKYQAYLRDSVPQLSQTFLDNQKKFFQQCDSAFKKDTEDELPYGFDYDWYTNSQEDPSYLLDGIHASGKWIINVKADEASVGIGAPENTNYVSGSLLIFVGLKKENGQWKISKIGND
jgi:hypothetical protein